MNNEIFQRYEYKICEEIYERAIDAFNDFYRLNGRKPKLILGWGSYLSICIVETKRGIPHAIFGDRILRLEEFNGCEIAIDPAYEFRIEMIPNLDTIWDTATECLFRS